MICACVLHDQLNQVTKSINTSPHPLKHLSNPEHSRPTALSSELHGFDVYRCTTARSTRGSIRQGFRYMARRGPSGKWEPILPDVPHLESKKSRRPGRSTVGVSGGRSRRWEMGRLLPDFGVHNWSTQNLMGDAGKQCVFYLFSGLLSQNLMFFLFMPRA